MGKFKKVCATIGGAAIISAAIMGMVSASTTGLNELDKSFVYDASYNPHVQIVVGEKAAAADVVGAGDIAATIGNLAYTTGACGAKGGSAGEVKLAVKSWQMIGKYLQLKESSSLSGNFYTSDAQMLENGTTTYREGSLKNYNIGCQIEKTVANFPLKVTNCNELCYLCYDICQETKNPDHEMAESISVDGQQVFYYEDGLGCNSKKESLKMKLKCKAITYTVDLGGIPVSSITRNDKLIDSDYRGKVLFMGSNDYFVNALSKTSITLAKGEKLRISSAGAVEPTLPQLQGYKFKLLRTIQSNGKDAGVVIEIEKPDGTSVQATASKQAGASLGTDAKGHKIQIQAYQVMGNEASIIAYDMSTVYKLEKNKKKDGWLVDIISKKCRSLSNAGVTGYDEDSSTKGVDCLTQMILTQEDEQILNVGDTIYFPTKAIKFSFEGFKDTDFGDVKCSGGDDKIKIETNDNYKVLLSFTTKEGQRINNVRLDEGPYNSDDMFLIGDTVYQFVGAETETKDGIDQMKINIKDISNAINLDPIYIPTKNPNGFPGFTYKDFNKYDSGRDSACPTCDTYNKTISLGTGAQTQNVMLYLKGSKLWLDKNNDKNLSLNTINLNDIQNDDCSARLWTADESKGEGNNSDDNSDDSLILFKGCLTDTTYIDLYDTDRKARGDAGGNKDYKTTVKIRLEGTQGQTPVPQSNASLVCYDAALAPQFATSGVLRCNDDTQLWSLNGADIFTVTNYGSDKQVKEVEICHPTKQSFMTYFIGKEKTEAEMIGTITEADVGKLKKIGCCEATVKSFGLSAGNATNATGTCTNMKPVGTLMVLDKNAGTGNLIVVGGPSINTLAVSAGVTAAEISADSDKYVIKMVNKNTLVVAGWEAEDTNAATDKVVEWLLLNAHKA
ncbi:MAG: S-layer protein [Candidatus Altarchaeum sp.]|nr:S-layer protein [Candidatus Altarchaeum sp.]